jgi:hypothetical protein
MKRGLFNLLTVVSLLLCAFTLTMWVWSHWATHFMYCGGWTTDGKRINNNRVALEWFQGRVVYVRDYEYFKAHSWGNEADWLRQPHAGWNTEPALAYKISSISSLSFWKRHGFVYDHRVGFRKGDLWYEDSYGNNLRVCVPAALPAAVFAILPAWWLISTVRRWRRNSQGLCTSCGYDLRATPDRCPECGTEAVR